MKVSSILWLQSPITVETNPPEIFSDLNLDAIVEEIVAGRDEYRLRPFFYTSLTTSEEVGYRQDVMRDLYQPAVAAMMHLFAEGMQTVRQYQAHAEKVYYQRQKQAWFLDAVASYVETVGGLDEALTLENIKSEGLIRFREFLRTYVGSAEFEGMRDQTAALKADLAGIRYGLTVDGSVISVGKEFDPEDFSQNFEALLTRFQRTNNQRQLRDPDSEALEMNHIEAKILEQVVKLYPEPFERLETFCQQQVSFLDPALREFDRELQFYLTYQDYMAFFEHYGLRFCYPRVSARDKTEWSRDSYDAALAHKVLSAHGTVVVNDFELSGEERILVVTGPNQGGKTTFARQFGQLHFLAKLGLPVPGGAAQLFLCDKIFTHFEREEDMSEGSGKLQDALLRMHAILSDASADSVIIMNEIFGSTTLQDAVFLTTKVLDQVTQLDAIAVLVTFIDELGSRNQKTVSLVASVNPNQYAQRTYKIVRGPAQGVAYALSLAESYGLTYSRIKERLQP